jgi:hypothetical protein
MSVSLAQRLDIVIRRLEKTNWITKEDREELKQIRDIIRGLRSASDRVRIAVMDLVDSTEVIRQGVSFRTLPGRGRALSSSIYELHKAVDEVRPRTAGEQKK